MAFYYLFDVLFPKTMIIIAKYDLLKVLNPFETVYNFLAL